MRRLLHRLFLVNFATLIIAACTIVFARISVDFYSSPLGYSQRAVALSIDAEQPERLERRLAILSAEFGGKASVYSPNGELIASSSDPPLPFDFRSDDRSLSGFASVDLDGHANGLVVFARPKQLLVNEASYVLLLGIVIGGGLALLFAFLATRRIVDPISRLIAASRDIARGEFGKTLALARRDELGQLSDAFDHMSRQLASLQRAQRELLASVSHEFRTPLARIRLVQELIHDNPQQARELLPELTCDVDELERLVNRVLEAARSEAEAVGPRTPIPIAGLLERAGGRFTTVHPERELVIERDRALGEVEVPVDLGAMLRALDNLLENACRYAPSGPIRLGAKRAGERVGLYVADQGPGIAVEQRELIFAPFVRGEGSRSRHTGGVGLGLTIVRKIAEGHGGSVELESEPGRGSSFTIWLPRA
jgi:signal transduction histidine kinase